MKRKLFFILCCVSMVLNAQQFETGVIIDSLTIANSTNETYALYLPKRYDPSKSSSLLFIFSPSANGKKGVETFIKSAEAYNLILICSNNSKNGSVESNFEIAQRLFNQTFLNFNILENSIYLAGFSGGSRLATAIACLSNQITGVIACGAGFIQDPSFMPSTQNFSYAALCGDRDMNYQEMIDVKVYLNRTKIHNTLFTFDGKHEWPPHEQLLMAFNWLEIEAVKKGHLIKTKAKIKSNYLNDFKIAKAINKDSQPLIAVEHYERILNKYNSFFILDSVSQEFQDIKKSKSYSTVFKHREKAFEKENTLTSFFLNRFSIDYQKPDDSSLKWWKKQLQKLNKEEVKSNVQMIKMFERLRFKIFVAAYTQINLGGSNKNLQQQNFCKSLISMLSSKKRKIE